VGADYHTDIRDRQTSGLVISGQVLPNRYQCLIIEVIERKAGDKKEPLDDLPDHWMEFLQQRFQGRLRGGQLISFNEVLN